MRNRLRDTEKLFKIRKFFQQNTEKVFWRLAALQRIHVQKLHYNKETTDEHDKATKWLAGEDKWLMLGFMNYWRLKVFLYSMSGLVFTVAFITVEVFIFISFPTASSLQTHKFWSEKVPWWECWWWCLHKIWEEVHPGWRRGGRPMRPKYSSKSLPLWVCNAFLPLSPPGWRGIVVMVWADGRADATFAEPI